MGKRGPPKKPTELKLLQGCPGGRSKLPKGEVKPQVIKDTDAPAELTDGARAVWEDMVPRLKRLNLFTELDVNTFRRYCELYARWINAANRLKQTGQTHVPIFHERTAAEIRNNVPMRLHYLQELPESIEFRKLPNELLRLEQQFGMTPAARASINVNTAPIDSKGGIKDFLYG